MGKAKYVGKYIHTDWGTRITELEYEYRGRRYTVTESSRGNEPLSWQHRNEQARIDSLIEYEEKSRDHDQGPSIDETIDTLLRWMDGEISDEEWESFVNG